MGIGLSQVGSQISSLQDQNHPTSNMLRLGSTGAAKFEHIIPPSNSSSLSTMPSSAFFMSDANQGSFPNKSLHGLMQLPDLQSSTDNSSTTNLFNLGFFSSNATAPNRMNDSDNANSSTVTTNLVNSRFLNSNPFNNGNGGQGTTTLFANNMGDHVGSAGISSLYSNSMQQENITPHMSATALLQKASQMGSTTSSNNPNLLRSLGSSPSTGIKSDRSPLVSTNFGSNSFGDATVGEVGLGIQMESDNQLQGLMNSLANGGSSIFGGGHGQDNSFGGFTSGGVSLEQHHNSTNFSKVEEAKLHQSLGVGSDKLTLDFLGVGGMVRSIGGGQHGINLSSLDSQSAQANNKRF